MAFCIAVLVGWIPLTTVSQAAAPADLPRFDLGVRSEQFTIHDTRRFGRSLAAFAAAEKNDAKWVQLEPEAVLVSAGRVRDALFRALRLPVREAEMIQCYLYAPAGNDDNVTLISTRYSDGWVYALYFPDAVERIKVVRAFAQVLLVQFANQGVVQKSAEIPTWLVEGIALYLLSEIGPELVVSGLPDNAFKQFGNAKVTLQRTDRIIEGADRLLPVRGYLRTGKVMSFTELSQGLLQTASDDQLQRYQMSALLFVAQLLQSPGGHARLSDMLLKLPESWNWQIAFLQAFGFERLLDVEKWWSLAATTFATRDPVLFGSIQQSLDKLDHILTVAAHVRASTNALPLRAEASLNEMLSEWDYATQRPFVQQKILQLAALRSSAPLPLSQLIDGYIQCLQAYLQKRDAAGRSSNGRREVILPARVLVRQAVNQLAALDQQRATFLEQGVPPNPVSNVPLANGP